jgi:alpha-tubulin suppressor-like RCC1 family protein
MFGAIKGFVKGDVRIPIIEDPTDENFWETVDISAMTRTELVIALQSRGLNSKGNKKKLEERLTIVVREEKEEELAYLALLEARARQEAEQEAAGSVYTIGDGTLGQLAIGVSEKKTEWQVLMETRGKGIKKLFAGVDGVFALSDNGEVFVWGGGGVGPAGYNMYPEAKCISDCRQGKAHLVSQNRGCREFSISRLCILRRGN